MRRKIIASIAILMVIATGTIVTNNFTNNRSTTIANEEQKGTTWTKIEHSEKTYAECSEKEAFNLEEKLDKADYIFKGTITNCDEYDVEWQDENGEQWGPYTRSIITANISEDYYGESPVSGDSIKIYYPYSISTEFENGFDITEGKEYIFVTQALDSEFIENRNSQNPYDKFEQEKYADVFISDSGYDLMAIDNENIVLCNGYVEQTNEISDEILTGEAVSEIAEEVDIDEQFLQNGNFIAINFNQILENLKLTFNSIHNDNININNANEDFDLEAEQQEEENCEDN